MNKQIFSYRRMIAAALALALVGQACTLSLFDNPLDNPTPIPPNAPPTSTPLPVAQTTFTAVLPEALPPNEKLVLAILDELTGLSINPAQYEMKAIDSLTYSATVPLIYNAVVKYRYVRSGSADAFEDAQSGAPIRYRMAHAAGPAEIRDIIGSWQDRTYARPTGVIFGQVFNADTGSPLPNLLVTAGGEQSLTDSTGRFELPDLPTGTHNLLVYSLDGLYLPFQQGAVVAENSSTAVDLRVAPAPLVDVTFSVAIPDSTTPGVPVRIAGNLLQLGNTFTDLQGGTSVIPERMPVMSLQPDGRYAVTLSLPAGTHLQYKYTLGDGFWNAERGQKGQWIVRDVIIPAQGITLSDTALSWSASQDSAPILFEVSAPQVTPPGDIVYIQFNAFGWMEPIPMWPLGNNRWSYKLYGPLNMLGSFNYRYCRNGQCGSADDMQTAGINASGRKVITSFTSQDLKDDVAAWKWYENPEPIAIVGTNITPRAGGFIAGIELQAAYRPNWSYYAPQAVTNVQALGANTIIVTPTWTFTRTSPPRFQTALGQDPSWIDSAIMISQARALGLNVALFPSANFSSSSNISGSAEFWTNAPRDAQWWQVWFARYRAFAVNYADLAAQTGSQTLILGGEWTAPALPNGRLPDGSSSTPPADVEAQWKAVIAEVRQHFKGQVFWALPYAKASLETPLNFLQDTDGVYLLWSAALTSNPGATKTDYANAAGQLLDNEVAPLAALVKKPIILAVAYPSAMGAANGCLPEAAGKCADWTALSQPNPDLPNVSLNLQTQADLYEAMLTAINSRQWISGFVSRGYHPPVALQDKSASVHGKPAADILWYWLPRLTGATR